MSDPDWNTAYTESTTVMYVSIGVAVGLALLVTLVVGVAFNGKERNCGLAVVLCLFCGLIPALVYIAVTKEAAPVTHYTIAPQPIVMVNGQAQPVAHYQQSMPPQQYAQQGVPPVYNPSAPYAPPMQKTTF